MPLENIYIYKKYYKFFSLLSCFVLLSTPGEVLRFPDKRENDREVSWTQYFNVFPSLQRTVGATLQLFGYLYIYLMNIFLHIDILHDRLSVTGGEKKANILINS